MVAGVGAVVVLVVGVVDKGAVVGDAVVTAGVSGVYRKIRNKECQMMDFQRKKNATSDLNIGRNTSNKKMSITGGQ